MLSIQSSVAYGHAGNSSAVFPMQRMGVDVIAVYTVHFSNHTGYGSWRGPLLTPDDVREVVTGVDERGALADLDAVLSGYQGATQMGRVILDAVALAKRRSPQALYCCDPVMGDFGRGMYVLAGIPEFMRDEVVPAADILTPNQFELDFLTDRKCRTLADVQQAADELAARGPSIVLVTSVDAIDAEPDTLTMLARSPEGTWTVTTPLLPRTFTGSGDFTTATFLSHYLATRSVPTALEQTASIVYSVLEQTTRSGREELQLVAAQENMINPAFRFGARRVR